MFFGKKEINLIELIDASLMVETRVGLMKNISEISPFFNKNGLILHNLGLIQ